MGLDQQHQLTEEQRAAWINTVLTVVCSEPQRRAFICGFNGTALHDVSRSPSWQMWERYKYGQQARQFLHGYEKRG